MGALEKIRGVVATIEERWDRAAASRLWKRGFSHLCILPYRGYATSSKLRVSGRVVDDLLPDKPQIGDTLWDNLRGSWRRFETDEVSGAKVRLTVDGQEHEAETDSEGFFHFCVDLTGPLATDRLWHVFPLEIVHPHRQPPVRAEAQVVAPSPDSEFVVVSDMDDTVIRTGATSTLRMIFIVALNNAHSRSPFEGVGAFYQALCQGPEGKGHNPILYVSSSPRNLYEMFDEFLEAHDIPRGPLFLKDYGLSRQHFLKSSHRVHKTRQIEILMCAWPNLPFVLIGDSGQQDPEIYQSIVKRNPKRVRAIADEAAQQGVPLILEASTEEAARQAVRLGLIRSGA